MRTFLIIWVVVMGLLFGVPVRGKAEEISYTYTLIADTTGPFNGFSFKSVSVNNAGTVSFLAGLSEGGSGIFTSSGGSVTTIATRPPFPSLFNIYTGLRLAATKQANIVTLRDGAKPWIRLLSGHN